MDGIRVTFVPFSHLPFPREAGRIFRIFHLGPKLFLHFILLPVVLASSCELGEMGDDGVGATC